MDIIKFVTARIDDLDFYPNIDPLYYLASIQSVLNFDIAAECKSHAQLLHELVYDANIPSALPNILYCGTLTATNDHWILSGNWSKHRPIVPILYKSDFEVLLHTMCDKIVSMDSIVNIDEFF